MKSWSRRGFHKKVYDVFTKKNEERFTFQNNNFIKLSDGRKWIVYTAWDITDLKSWSANYVWPKRRLRSPTG